MKLVFCILVIWCLQESIASYCSESTLTVVTGAHYDTFESLQNLAGSIHVWSPSLLLEVYDLGLSEEQRRSVDSWNSTQLLNVQHLIEDVTHLPMLWTHAYKPILIVESLERHKCSLWLDAGVELRNDAMSIFHSLDNDGFWFSWGGYEFEANSSVTSMNQITFDPTGNHYNWVVSTSHIGLSKEHSIYKDIVIPWRDCAIDCSCIYPSQDTTLYVQDQTILNQLLYASQGFIEEFVKENGRHIVHVEVAYWLNTIAKDWTSHLTKNELQHNDIVLFTRRSQLPYLYSKYLQIINKEPNEASILWNSTVINWEKPREVYPDPILLKKHEVAICAVFANEGTYLQEWIEYHKLAGVTQFYLYEALSSPKDVWRDVLFPYVQEGLVTVSRQYQNFSVQGATYEHCLSEHAADSHWIMFVDIDEYVVVKEPYNSIPELLEEFSEETALVLPWKTFCSSGHLESTPEGLSTANYDKFIPCNNLTSCDQLSLEIKLILNTAKAPLHRCVIANAEGFFHNCLGDDVVVYVQYNLLPTSYEPFATIISGTGLSAVDEQHREVWSNFKMRHEDFILPSYDKIQLNHYHVRSCPEWKRRCSWKREWIQRHFSDKSKIERLPFARRRINENYCHEIEPKCTGVDESMQRYIPLLEKAIEQRNEMQLFTNKTDEDLQVNTLNQIRQLEYLEQYYSKNLAEGLDLVWSEIKTLSIESILAFHVDIYSPFLLSASRNHTFHFYAYQNVSSEIFIPIYLQGTQGVLHRSLEHARPYDAVIVEYEELIKPTFSEVAQLPLSDNGTYFIVFSEDAVNCVDIVSVLRRNMFEGEIVKCTGKQATVYANKRSKFDYMTTQFPVWKSHKGKIWLYDQVFNMRGAIYWGLEGHSYTFNGLWEGIMGEIIAAMKNIKLNVIRIPISPMLPLQNVSPRAQTKEWWGMQFEFIRKSSMQILDMVIDKLGAEGIMVILELYTEPTSAWQNTKFTEADLLKAWDILLTQFENRWNLMGISIADGQPTATWATGCDTDWDAEATRVIQKLAEEHSNFTGLFFVTPPDHVQLSSVHPHFIDLGSEELNQRLVYAVGVAGPDTGVDMPELEEENFPNNFPEKWDYYFSFREHINQSVIIGAWGGKYLPDTKDRIWQPFFVNYLVEHDIRDTIYWNLHPDGGGLLAAGWVTANQEKGALLDQLQPDPTEVSFDDESGVTQYMYTANKATYHASMQPDKPPLKKETLKPKPTNSTASEKSTQQAEPAKTQPTQQDAGADENFFESSTFEDLGLDWDFDSDDLEDEFDSMMGLGYKSDAMQVLSELVEGIVFLEKQKMKYQYMLQLQKLEMQATIYSQSQSDSETKNDVEKQLQQLEELTKPVSSWRKPRQRFNYETLVEF